MSEWRNEEGGYSEEDDARKQRIKRSEEFSCISTQNIHRTHPRQNHGSIQERINPIEPAQVMVPRDAKSQAKSEDAQGEHRMVSDAL